MRNRVICGSFSQLTLSPCGFLQMCILISTHEPANPKEMHCLLIVPYPQDEQWCVHQGSYNNVHRAGNIWIDDRGCYVHMGLCEGDGYLLCCLWVCITGEKKESMLTDSDDLLTRVAAASVLPLLLLLLHGPTYTEPAQHLSCMQLS